MTDFDGVDPFDDMDLIKTKSWLYAQKQSHIDRLNEDLNSSIKLNAKISADHDLEEIMRSRIVQNDRDSTQQDAGKDMNDAV